MTASPNPAAPVARIHPVSMRGFWLRGPKASRLINTERVVQWVNAALTGPSARRFTDF